MSPPNFSPDTTQVLSGYGLAFSAFLSLFASALNPISGAARKLDRRTETVSFFNDFIIFNFGRHLLYAFPPQNTQSFFAALRLRRQVPGRSRLGKYRHEKR